MSCLASCSRSCSRSLLRARRTYATAVAAPTTPSTSSSSAHSVPPAPSTSPQSTPSPPPSPSPSESSRPSPLPNIPRPAGSWRPRRPLFPRTGPQIQLPQHFGSNQLVPVPDATHALLTSVVNSFRAPIRYAFAYGSGIFPQTGPGTSDLKTGGGTDGPGAGGGGKKPMLDFIFATTHADHFHSINMAHNPSHYPGYMRLMGSDSVSWIQQKGGAGVWFNAYVEVQGVMIKYGVVTMDKLCKDLIEWETLYLSGRMHKPIRIIRDDPRVKLANQVNLTSALRVALLTLPDKFQEHELYERIAGLSYAGDPRMSIPGAENPRKVQNIVDSQLDKFKGVYGRLLSELDGLDVHTVGPSSGLLAQNHSPEHRASLARKLPRTLKTSIRAKYADRPRDQTESADEKALWTRIGGEPTLAHELIKQTSAITRGPAWTQSIKGIITAGPLKSLAYSTAKFGKYRQAMRDAKEQERVAAPAGEGEGEKRK